MSGEATRGAVRAQIAPLLATLEDARWFQGKGRPRVSLDVVDIAVVPDDPGAAVAIVAVELDRGEVHRYALFVRREGGEVRPVGEDDALWRALARMALDGTTLAAEHGTFEASPGAASKPLAAGPGSCRALEADQSNTSLLLDGRLVLKCYRRLRPGPHPELELLQGLTRVGSRRAPALLGSLAYRHGGDVTALASLYAYVEGEPVGWEPAIARLAQALDGDDAGLEREAREAFLLGRCAGELHRDLLAAFGGVEATAADVDEARARARAGLAEALAAAGPTAPELAALEPAARSALAGLERLAGTRLQRVHGDLHVGQIVSGPSGLVVIDFEGDPTRPTSLRGSPAPALQDVASLLLSLDHVAAAAARRRGTAAAAARARAWSTRARDAAIEGYSESQGAIDLPLLAALEVEKEWREALYAARVLPEWLYAPRFVLPTLLA